MIDEIIDEVLKDNLRVPEIGRYYPSACSGCTRKQWFSYKNPKPTSPQTQRIFAAGNSVHDFVHGIFKKSDKVKLLFNERSFEMIVEDFNISGRIDNVVQITNEKGIEEKYIVEVKSTSSLKYLSEPQKHHIQQAHWYMRSMRIWKAIIIYVEKLKFETKEFFIEFNPEVYDGVLSNVKTLHHHLKTNTLPEANGEDWECGWCDYKDECREAAGAAEGIGKV